MYIVEQIDFNRFNDFFALKWLILIISMNANGVIEKVEFNGSQLVESGELDRGRESGWKGGVLGGKSVG